jgi:hypothetical protein
MKFKLVLLTIGLTATVSELRAVTVNTADGATITAFQNGASVELFDNLSALGISSYASVAVPAINQFSSRNINDPNIPSFNSGGATFNDPASNPGTLVGVFDPSDGIANEFSSPNNVIGPLLVGSDLSFGTGFMEVIFQNPVDKVGFQVTHGSLTLILKDVDNNNLVTGDVQVNGNQGNFIGIQRDAADIGGITILSLNANDSFTLDDFTFGLASGTNIPDGGATAGLLALSFVGIALIRRKLSA